MEENLLAARFLKWPTRLPMALRAALKNGTDATHDIAKRAVIKPFGGNTNVPQLLTLFH